MYISAVVSIAVGALPVPAIGVLGEPTIGLDIISKNTVRRFLLEVNRDRNVTVLLTTHDLSDIEQLCERVMVIDHGRLVYDGGIDGLRSLGQQERTLVVDFAEALPAVEVDGARVVRVEGPRQWLAFPASASAAPLLSRIGERYPLVDLSVQEPEIEHVIARLYRTSVAELSE